VLHAPSGETWLLACDEDEYGKVFPAGWPECCAEASDCTLKRAATDEQRLKMLRDAAKLGADYATADASKRRSVARRQLIALEGQS
jgi:hypothetical protein